MPQSVDILHNTYYKYRMKKIFYIIPVLLLLAMASFAQVKTVWKDVRFLKEPIQKLVVISQFENAELRKAAEESMISALHGKGIDAVGAYEIFTYDSTNYYSTLERKLDSAKVDGILVMKMIEERSTDMYILPEELIPPYAYNYYEYYSFYYYNDLPLISDPNYYRKPNRSFRMDVYVFQNKGDMVVWSGQSKQLDPLNPEKAIAKLSKKVAKVLLSQDVAKKSDSSD